MKNFLEDYGFVIIGFSIAVILIMIVVIIGHRQCSLAATLLQVDYQFNFFSVIPCRVEVNQHWIPIENFLIGRGQ